MKKIAILTMFLMAGFASVGQDWIANGELMSSVRTKLNYLKAEVDTIQQFGSDSLWLRSGNYLYTAIEDDSVGIGTDTAGYKLDVRGNFSIGSGAAGDNTSMYFRGESHTGRIGYHEDEDAFSLTGSVLIPEISREDTAKYFLTYNIGTGEIKYSHLIHGVGSADSIIDGSANNYIAIGGSQNIYYKISTAAAASGAFTSHEADGVLMQGDSIKILTAGDYRIDIFIALTTSNANDKIRIKLYINNLPSISTIGRFLLNSGGSGNPSSREYSWYKKFAVNDWLSWRVVNISGARAVLVTDYKILITKMTE